MDGYKEVSERDYEKFIEEYPKEKLTRITDYSSYPKIVFWVNPSLENEWMAWCGVHLDGSREGFHVSLHPEGTRRIFKKGEKIILPKQDEWEEVTSFSDIEKKQRTFVIIE